MLTGELAASELFGHRKGSFTGAVTDKAGCMEEADGGTLFLDEVGNLPPEVQQKLLRALQTKCYRPMGSTRERRADVRIVAATNENLEKAVEEGRFRRDLYHRLKEFVIQIPPLRECRGGHSGSGRVFSASLPTRNWDGIRKVSTRRRKRYS